MTTSVEKIRDAFPFLSVEPIVGQPTYETIQLLHKKLNANAASIHSHLGNGKLGLLYLTVKPEVLPATSGHKQQTLLGASTDSYLTV